MDYVQPTAPVSAEAVTAARTAAATRIKRAATIRYVAVRAAILLAVVGALGYMQLSSEGYSLSGEIIAESYARLGLAKGAAPADIKRAYRRLAAAVHPDRDKSPEAAARFTALATAYQNLLGAEGDDLFEPSPETGHMGSRVRRESHPMPPRSASELFPGASIGTTAMLLSFIGVVCCGYRRRSREPPVS
eukprot:c27123_g1_i1.p1 GENE.c27123_g1_i1~~c27123_g1_i1.p1  ORF type:complete len:212 (+),score=30.52 c27123_g1_i1:69-638(+)